MGSAALLQENPKYLANKFMARESARRGYGKGKCKEGFRQRNNLEESNEKMKNFINQIGKYRFPDLENVLRSFCCCCGQLICVSLNKMESIERGMSFG